MDIPDFNYRLVDEFDVSEIAHEISILDSTIWNLDQVRQSDFPTHQATKSIYISSLPLTWRGKNYNLQKHLVSEKLNQLTYNIADKLENVFDGKLGRSLYVNLPAKQEIPVHRDTGYYLINVHRLHIPIITNDSVKFFLNGDVVTMKTGSCYEINNVKNHAVSNKGNTDRIHLIMDIIPKKAFKYGY